MVTSGCPSLFGVTPFSPDILPSLGLLSQDLQAWRSQEPDLAG